jgi:cytochrome P450
MPENSTGQTEQWAPDILDPREIFRYRATIRLATETATFEFNPEIPLPARRAMLLKDPGWRMPWPPLRAAPESMETAVEEILRYAGPIHGSKQAYALEDVTLHGVTIPKGAAVFPVFGAANRDPAVFERPEVFDITRTPNRHLGFGHGIHFCLGAGLARMEARIAFKNLLERNPHLRLAVAPETLRLQYIPMWHRYESLPVALG